MRDALALALVHFIWQGALLAIAGALLMRAARVPSVRYAIGIATMLAMLLAPVMTFLAVRNAVDQVPQSSRRAQVTDSNSAARTDTRPLAFSTSGRAAQAQNAMTRVIVPAAWILNVWAVGVMVLSLRFVGGWAVARRLAAQTLMPAGEELQALASQMAARLNVRSAVRVCESASVAVPMMLGCLRPVIILPPAAVIALPLAQLEALLAHELAHIRRHDYLVNLLQTGVETLCFYHPAVWWISREVRRHREHCCDDIAVSVCDRLTYVTALSSLASISTPQFALSAAGGSLRDRVRRLVEPTTHSASSKGAWIAMLPILLVVSLVAPQALSTQPAAPATAAPAVVAAAPFEAATAAQQAVPAEQSRSVTRAREAARAQAETELELVRRAQAALLEQASTERAKVREMVEAAQSREATRASEVAREVRRVLEANRDAQEVTQEAVRRQLQRARELRSQSDVTELESRLREMERMVARQKELADRGLATRNNLIAAEEQLHQTRQHLERARAQHEMTTHLQELRHDLEARHNLTTARRNLSELDSSATLEPQDRLTITIDDEPDLPRVFTVRADGSIRFPFLGSIRVQGSTTAQVRSAIQKLISDKGLARNPVVNVSASRMR